MQTITVYDPPMCCSTGVCGPEIDPKLAQFAGDLDWLKEQGIRVERINLAQEPGRFVENAAVKEMLGRSGGDDLPAIIVGDTLVANGRYPDREELASFVGLPPQFTPEARHEAVRIGEAVKAMSAKNIVGLAEKLIGSAEPKANPGGCCGTTRTGEQKSSGCC